jgi:nitrite reductase/ring-hydroxylating ferredoxin subunit
LAEGKRLICASADLVETGTCFRFRVNLAGHEADAFAVRFGGKVFGYINECGHIPVQLDWRPGEFFDETKLYLICSVHGALYAPDLGRCLGGRCQGKGLAALDLDEAGGQVFLVQENIHG